MDKFVIEGGASLNGTISTNGSKNSALPALAAALLTADTVVLERIPRVRDIRTMERLLVDIGSESGIIEKSGAWYSYGAQRIGQGRENAKMFLKDNPALMAEVEEKVKVVLGVRGDAGLDADAAESGADNS